MRLAPRRFCLSAEFSTDALPFTTSRGMHTEGCSRRLTLSAQLLPKSIPILKPLAAAAVSSEFFPGEKNMSKMTGTAKSVLFASLCALFAASLPASAADNFLADRHKAKGLSCQMCHGQDMKNPQTPTIETCTTCHQKDALVKKTARSSPPTLTFLRTMARTWSARTAIWVIWSPKTSAISATSLISRCAEKSIPNTEPKVDRLFYR